MKSCFWEKRMISCLSWKMTMAIHSQQTLIWLPSTVLCSSTDKSSVTTSYDCTYIWEFHCTLEDHAPLPLSWFQFFRLPWNEMWRWYTVWDENPDRDRDRTEVTEDIPPCLTARQLKYSRAYFIFRRLSSCCQVPIFSPENHETTVTPVILWCFLSAECCCGEIVNQIMIEPWRWHIV